MRTSSEGRLRGAKQGVEVKKLDPRHRISLDITEREGGFKSYIPISMK